MQIQLIRNATLKIHYNGVAILLDPMFADKGSIQSFAGIEKNPTVDLPISISQILKGIGATLVTHIHPDHFDEAAINSLEKSLPIFCQPTDYNFMLTHGFANVVSISTYSEWKGITIFKTDGKHGSGPILEHMGTVSGFVLKSANEPTLYITGDTIFNDDVRKAIDEHRPEVIITNSGGAVIPGFEEYPILMNEQATADLSNYAPFAKIIAVHIGALDHCRVTRESFKQYLQDNTILQKQIYILNDAEIISL